jgi:hypothetical protein
MIGTPSVIHSKNDTRCPASRSSMPTPMRLGGVPTGVPIPPIDAANDVISIIAIANRRTCSRDAVAEVRARCDTIDSPIGNIMAVVAVLLIHIDTTMHTPE